jgi:hypothetical protein
MWSVFDNAAIVGFALALQMPATDHLSGGAQPWHEREIAALSDSLCGGAIGDAFSEYGDLG